MDRTRLKRIVVRMLIFISTLYMVCLVLCMFSVFHMHTLTYSSAGWGVVLAEYKLDFENDRAEVNRYHYDGTLMSCQEGKFSSDLQTKLRFACAFSLMPAWRSQYVDSSIADGDQWYIIIDYGGKEKQTYGSNAYPLLYHLAYDTIQSIFTEEEFL